MDEDLEPAHHAPRHGRPNPYFDACPFQYRSGPCVAGGESIIMSAGIIKKIVRAVGRICRASALFIKPEGRANLANYAAILCRSHTQHFSERQRLGVCQVIDMQCRFIRTKNRAPNIATFDIPPGFSVAIDGTVTPTDHCMGAVKHRIGELVGANEVAQIFTFSDNGHDQADMYAIGFDKDHHAVTGFCPSRIHGQVAAYECGRHVKADNQHGPAEQCAQCCPDVVDAKQFQV